MKWIALGLLAVVAFAVPAAAPAGALVYRTTPSADVSLPFLCDWGYDWDERCYRDFSDRLSVGGDADKVWRAALRFPLSAIPQGSIVDSATLSLSFDGVCLAPLKTEQPCPARIYTIDVHPVLSRNWFREREVDFGPLAEQASLWAGTPQRVSWDVTNLVTDWVQHGTPNYGPCSSSRRVRRASWSAAPGFRPPSSRTPRPGRCSRSPTSHRTAEAYSSAASSAAARGGRVYKLVR